MAGVEPIIGKTARGHAVYTPNHPSYAHLEKVRMVGADTTHLGQLARQAQPHYRAVDHEEASAMHYARRNFHAARAHEAASAAMSKSDGGMVPAYASNLAWVYQGAEPGLSLDDAAGAIRAVTLTWSAQDHLDNAVLQHCLAQSHGESDTPEDLQRQALCAAAAFMHFAAAGVDPTTGPVAASMGKGPVAKSLAVLARAELGKSVRSATEAELTAVVRKALSPKALTPVTPRKPAQIGTTRSGKAIFDTYHHPAHSDFDAKDWADAGNAVAAGIKFRAKVAARKRTPVTKSDVVKGAKPLGAAFSHARKVAAKTGGGKAKERAVAQRYLSAKGHGKMAKAGGGEGSRGGHIIGHTRNGNKPIYAADHESYSSVQGWKDKPKGRESTAWSNGNTLINAGASIHKKHSNKLRDQVIAAHPTYTKDDHIDASKHHYQNSTDAEDDRSTELAQMHRNASRKKGMAKSLPGLMMSLVKAGSDDDHPHIGTTSSGHKIYGINHPGHRAVQGKGKGETNGAKVREMYPHFTAKDHQEAAYVHAQAQQHHIRKNKRLHSGYIGGFDHGYNPTSTRHNLIQIAHRHAAGAVAGRKSPLTTSKPAGHGGEGSRGGHVVSHSKTTGAPIYAAHGAIDEAYRGEEHDAKPAPAKAEAKPAPAAKVKAPLDAQGKAERAAQLKAKQARQAKSRQHPSGIALGDASKKYLGTTLSGYPVHKVSSVTHDHPDWAKLTHNDHLHAASNYHQEADRMEKQGGETAASHINRAQAYVHSAKTHGEGHGHYADKDLHMAAQHEAKAKALSVKKSTGSPVLLLDLSKARGKGSRGGVIVGFAPNGSPIYSGHRVRSSKARKEAIAEAKKDDTNKSLGNQLFTIRG